MASFRLPSSATLPPALTARERAEVESYFAKSGGMSNTRLAWTSVILPIAAALFLLMSLGLVGVPVPDGIGSLLAPVAITNVG